MIKKILGLLILIQISLLADFKHIDIEEAQKLMQKNVPIIDIRTPPEWKETGVIKGSHKLMFFDDRGKYDVQKWLNDFGKIVKDKNQPFILVCRTASRTNMVGQFLANQMGYKNVYDLKGGIVHWKRSGKKTVK
jgi:rhodanese-related sulfurtransferase